MLREGRYKLLPYEAGRYQWDGRGSYTQWWYFDGEFESGHRVMTIMLPRLFGEVDDHGNGPVPGITLVIMEPDRTNHHSHAYYPEQFDADPDRMKASFANDLVEYHDGRYHIRARQGEVGFDLEYSPTLPPWPPFPGRRGFMAPPLLLTLAPGKYFHYASFVPRGAVAGSLYLPSGEVEVRGEGYHEQGRTNAPFHGLFSYWYWTRFYMGDWTFIFPVARAPRRALNATMRALLAYRGNECAADLFDVTGLLLRHEVTEYQESERTGRSDVPRRAVFSARLPHFKLEVEMDLFHELEAFRFTPFGDTSTMQPAWLQHIMNVKARGRWHGQPFELDGEGVFETMLTGSK